ncbi:glycosyltransferase family 4 protein [Limisphaera ngatamarikiensis]|uniref:Glycosyltransferase family 4 protein n=1 Tax=Limisphaera ngatamarikiensis TaxID=1324935 RepID=A0A6M1RRN1_9BACT|nr:glycosyltransferase family 4 protein [Limisphaera ngatamarikiensis]NGO40179.1 glycosyltransferase family 4 protein [Limisphaera ngatamarikiensis]
MSRIILIASWSGAPKDGRRLRHYFLLRELATQYGWQATLVAENTRLAWARLTLEHEGLEVLYLPALPVLGSAGGLLRPIIRAINMVLFLLTILPTFVLRGLLRHPAVFWGSSPHPANAVAAFIFSALTRQPFIYEVRDPWPELLSELGYTKPNSLAYRILVALDAFLKRRAALVIGVTPACLARSPDERPRMIIPQTLPNDAIARYGNLKSQLKPRVAIRQLYCGGGIGKAHGISTLLDALQLLRSRKPQLSFTLLLRCQAGTIPPLREAIHQRDLFAHVRLEPLVDYETHLLDLALSGYALLHLDSLPSLRTGISSNKLLDAFLVGTPVILAADAENNVVERSGAGFICRPGRPDELAEVLARALTLPDDAYWNLVDRALAFRDQHLVMKPYTDSLHEHLRSISGMPSTMSGFSTREDKRSAS